MTDRWFPLLGLRGKGPFFVPDRCIPSAISFSETVISANCRGYANFCLHANLKKRTSRGGILWRWQASMSSENSAIRDLKKGTGSDRGHLTKKRSNALCQKVVFLSSFCNRRGYASVWPGRFDGHVWRVCAKHGGIPQNYGREKLEKTYSPKAGPSHTQFCHSEC